MLGEQLCLYPGCKAKLRAEILPVLRSLAEGVDEFVDVFAGAGGIALPMMFRCPDLDHVVNDLDPTVIALWLALRDQPERLIERIKDTIPVYEGFRHARRALRAVTQLPDDPAEILEVALLRLVKQTTTIGGWMNGGPRRDIGRKWSPNWLRSTIRLNSDRMRFPRSVEITNRNFVSVIGNTNRRRRLLFLDPPYWLNNPAWKNHYYTYEFSTADHARLAEILWLTPHRWVLTYGDHPRIRALYEWACIETLSERELLITPSG
jgi:DNA adenine methylase